MREESDRDFPSHEMENMEIGKVSSKGRVTLPKKIREYLGLHPGDLISYEVKDEIVSIRRLESFDVPFYSALPETLGSGTARRTMRLSTICESWNAVSCRSLNEKDRRTVSAAASGNHSRSSKGQIVIPEADPSFGCSELFTDDATQSSFVHGTG